MPTHPTATMVSHNPRLRKLQSKKPARRLKSQLIYSEHPDAEHRRWTRHAAPALPSMPPIDRATNGETLLVVNDHPLKAERSIDQKVAAMLDRYIQQGFTILTENDDAEVAVRGALPVGMIEKKPEYTSLLAGVLDAHRINGVLFVTGDAEGNAEDVRILKLP